jgi:hypothetical protein
VPKEIILSEYQEQVKVFNYCNAKGLTMVAVPNDSWSQGKSAKDKRNMFAYMNKKKASGFCSGFPDFMVMNKQGDIIFIELKRKKGGTVSRNQKVWIEHLNSINQKAFICRGADEAIETINENL